MIEKPTSGDEEQRRHQTRVAREQSGLPPDPDAGESDENEQPPKRGHGTQTGSKANR